MVLPGGGAGSRRGEGVVGSCQGRCVLPAALPRLLGVFFALPPHLLVVCDHGGRSEATGPFIR